MTYVGYGAGFVQPMGGMGYGMGMGMPGGFGMFNRWAVPGMNYQAMNGFSMVDYSGGWNPMIHDQMLMAKIDIVFQRYDFNFSGQLEGQEFFFAYRDLCLMMGVCPPTSYQDIWSAVMACDMNRDGRISRMELFMLFKRIQGINAGMMMPMGGMGMGGMGMGGMGGMGMMGPGMGGMGWNW